MRTFFRCLIFAGGIFLSFTPVFADEEKNNEAIYTLVKQVEEYRNSHAEEIIDELKEYLSIPNWAGDSDSIKKNIDFVRDIFERRSIDVEILESTDAAPVVFGSLVSPGAEFTLVVYTHLDGQPVRQAKWHSAPYEATLRKAPFHGDNSIIPDKEVANGLEPDWRLFARSSSDDKSPLIAVLAAIDALRAIEEFPPINIKFFVETEEELGSPNLGRVLKKYGSRFDDGDIWMFADGPMHETGAQQIVFGVRGVTGAELTVYGASRPLHSGHYGNYAPNPAMRLAHLLSTMRAENGEILISGFERGANAISEESLTLLHGGLKNRRQALDLIGVAEAEMPNQFREEAVLVSALNIKGLASAGVGRDAKNIVPDTARASIGFRLAPGIEPDQAVDLFEMHIQRQGYHIVREEPDLQTRLMHDKIARVDRMRGGYPSAFSNMDSIVERNVLNAVQAIRADLVVIPLAGGSLPLHYFQEAFNVPFFIAPIANADNNQHAPNENIRVGNFYSGIDLYAVIMHQVFVEN